MKQIQKSLLPVLLIFLAFFVFGCSPSKNAQLAAGNAPLTVKMLDVGQGDSLLIRTAGQVVLVDTGDVPAREKLVAQLKKEGISTIDKLIITHPHADHMGGAQAVFDNFTVKQVYDSGQTTTTGTYKQYLNTIKQKKIPFALLAAGDKIELDQGIVLNVMAPEKPYISGSDSDLNNNSIVMKLVFRSFSMLFTGDAEKESEERILKRFGGELKSTVLKSGHHGSSTASSAAFIKAVSPEAALISLGANNEYHHPHPSVLKRYEQQKIKVYRTDTDGTITVTSDGNSYNIAKEK